MPEDGSIWALTAVLFIGSAVSKVLSNASVFAYQKDVTDNGIDIVAHVYETDYFCLDTVFEILNPALSVAVLLFYSYIAFITSGAKEFYWVILMVPYFWQFIHGIIYTSTYCYTGNPMFTEIPINQTLGGIFADDSIDAFVKSTRLF